MAVQLGDAPGLLAGAAVLAEQGQSAGKVCGFWTCAVMLNSLVCMLLAPIQYLPALQFSNAEKSLTVK